MVTSWCLIIRETLETSKILTKTVSPFFSLVFYSFCFRRTTEVGTHVRRQESKVEKGNRFAFIRDRLHSWVCPFSTESERRNKHGGKLCVCVCLNSITSWSLNKSLILQIMVTQQRKDLLMNIPALRKLDAMLIVRNHPCPAFQNRKKPKKQLLIECLEGRI